MSRCNSLAALLPAHELLTDVIAEQLATDAVHQMRGDYDGEQFAPPPQPQPKPTQDLSGLQGNPQLVIIAQNDPGLALKLKWLLDACNEADWEIALKALEHIHFSIRVHHNESRADEAGIVRR